MSLKTIKLNDREIACQEDDSVLDALLRDNIDIPNNCRRGVCQSCMIRSLDNAPPAASQKGLSDVLQHQNYFLACLCYPEQDMTISLNTPKGFFTETTVIDKKLLNSDMLLLTLKCSTPLDYYAGQFVNLKRHDGLQRSYSIANNHLLNADSLTFHIRKLKDGLFSEWAYQELAVGDTLDISGPQGLCYYLPNQLDQNLMLIGTGSGLAPLLGIISEALHQGHRGDIHLFHGSREIEGLYLIEEMQQLTQQYQNFYYTPCLSSETLANGYAKGRAHDVAMSTIPRLKDWRIYLCGHPDMVHQAKRQAFLKGAAIQNIYADAFHVGTASAH